MNTPELPEALRAHLTVSFDLVRLLGEGGMGVVWLGRDRLLEREVAIKVLRAETADTADGARRFLQEARLAARLQHPGVVPLLTFGEVGGHRYYVMPYARGETLADRIRRGPLGEDETRRIIAEVADALAYVHAQGIVHRDVKPANILLEEGTGRAMLTDFGIARGAGSTTLTATGMVVGTPLYLAPEQAAGSGEQVDGRADLYALGVVAWEALTGVSPFVGATPQEVLVRKMVEGVPSVRHSLPAVKPVLADAIDRATAVDAATRWQSAAEFAAAVRSSDDVDPDPIELRPLRSVGTGWILVGTPILWVFLELLVTMPTSTPLWMRMAGPFAIAAGMNLLFAYGRCQSLRMVHAPRRTWRELLPIVMRPLSFWFAWWPRRWVGFDLADHVPAWLRRHLVRERRIGTVGIAAVSGLFLYLAAIGLSTGEELVSALWFKPEVQQLVVASGIVGTLGLVGTIAHLQRRLAKRLQALGLTGNQIGMISNRQFDASILREPFMQSLLTSRTTVPDEPRELPAFADAIAALSAQLKAAGWPLGDLTPFLVEVRAADAQWAREADELAADADPVEATRLRERLARFQGAARAGAHQDEMVRLIERQLELQERATERRAAILARRERLREGCALLWRQLRSLRAEHARRDDSGAITGSIRALCADVSSDISAEQETVKLISSEG